MRPTIVAGNWKMNGSQDFVRELLTQLREYSRWDEQVEAIVFPPFPYLLMTESLLNGTSVAWGAQTLSEFANGAYTGEVSAEILQDCGCEYVLVGHSERRQWFHESSAAVAAKFEAAKQAGLIPILCVGETREQREAGKTLEVIFEQIQAVLKLPNGIQWFQQAVIAYEPVWAIGTGLTATPEQAQSVHRSIRQLLAEHDSKIAENCPILYGGSVKPSNAAELFQQADIDGGLIGGAALKAEDFIAIYQAACR